MCGVCGGGVVRGPWEDAVTPRGPRALAERAAALESLCAPLRWRVRPFGAAGFTVTTPTGAGRTRVAVQSAGSSSPASTTTSSLQADGSAAPVPQTRTRTLRRSRLVSGGAPQATSTDSSPATRPDDQSSISSS